MKPNSRLALLGLLIMALLAWVALRPATTIFTCTTFFDFEKQDKWAAFCRAMDSIVAQHTPETLGRIDRWLVVNEYSAAPKADWRKRVRARYPFIDFVQKGVGEKGQAASMNRILREIDGYDYWIHWEETWYCEKPCLDRMLVAAEETGLAQIQVTRLKGAPNWSQSPHHPREAVRTRSGLELIRVHPSVETDKYSRMSVAEAFEGDVYAHWPLYSLLPSINRVSVATTVGRFSTDPDLWPVKFEWDYARRWLAAGGTKAILPDGPVVRDEAGHKSTYA